MPNKGGTIREVQYAELQVMDDGHEALWFQTTGKDDANGHPRWFCMYLPAGMTFNANPEIGPHDAQ